MIDNPCLTCGACCGALRVSFHQRQTTRHGGTVPWRMTEPAAAALHRRMQGTPGRCVALEGRIGAATCCTIYEGRPEVCRDLQPGTEACDASRAMFGLAPIGPVTRPGA